MNISIESIHNCISGISSNQNTLIKSKMGAGTIVTKNQRPLFCGKPIQSTEYISPPPERIVLRKGEPGISLFIYY